VTIRKILTLPNQSLLISSKPVEFNPDGSVPDDVKVLAQDMLDTMYNSRTGVGLAAPQVGVNLRLIVVDSNPLNKGKNPLILINPELSDLIGTVEKEEGCLSVPGRWGVVSRPRRCKVKYFDLNGKQQIIDASGLQCRILLHECDHLDGKLFTDYLST
jgi:peptide deformylase